MKFMRYLKAILIFLLIVFNVSCFANNSKSSNAKNSVTKIQKTKESTGNMFDELENRAPYDFQKDWNKNVEKFENRWKQASIEREKEREKSNANWKKSQDEWNSSDAFWNKTPKKLEEKPAKEVDIYGSFFAVLMFGVLCFVSNCLGGDGKGKVSSSNPRRNHDNIIGSETNRWPHLRASYMHRKR